MEKNNIPQFIQDVLIFQILKKERMVISAGLRGAIHFGDGVGWSPQGETQGTDLAGAIY